MDPLNPWLDPVETRRLAERLMTPLSEPSVAPDPGFDAVFVGFEAMRPVIENEPQPWPTAEIVSTPEPAVSEMQSIEETLPPPLPVAETAASTTARGPFLDRIHRLCEWLREHFSASEIFILDRDGSVIFDESNHGRLHFMARSLALASRRPGAPADHVHVKIGANATLEVIPVNSAFGWLVLGAIVPDSLPTASVEAIKRALLQVASPRPADPQ